MTRPTPAGVAVALTALVAALAAWRLRWDELWALAGGAGAAVGLALLACQVVAPVRGTRRDAVDRVTSGDPLAVTVTLSTGRRSVRRQPALDRLGDDLVEVDLPSVRARTEREVTYSIPTRRRGHLPLGPVVVDEGDPLGLFRAVAEVVAPTTVIVHPRHHPLVLDPSGRRRDLDGLRTDLAEGSITFHALRDYVPGDDLRRVHWRSSARTGTLVVRHDVDPSEPRTLLLVDLAAEAWPGGRLEEGLEVAASVVRAAGREGLPLRLVRPAERAVDAGRDGTPVLDALAAAAVVPGLGAAWASGADGLDHAAGTAVVVTGDGERADDVLDHLRAVADRSVAVVVDPDTATGVRRAAGGGMVVTGPDARTICASWGRWGR